MNQPTNQPTNKQYQWQVMRKFGVPEKLVRLLEALHEHVNVHLEVEEATVILKSIIGVKQGDLLGPQLFIFHICAIMQTWEEGTQCPVRSL